jgi:hypothetical protein
MKKIFLYSFTLFITLAASVAFAKIVNLYDQPQTSAKVISTVDASSHLVPIISNKTGDWMKVGDPSNGNVGWVKISDFSDNSKNGSASSGFTMTEKTVDSAHGPQTYRTIQFGTPNTVTTNFNSPVAEEIIKRAEAQQLQMQRNSQQILQNIYHDMNMLYQNTGNASTYPVFMPVIFMPAAAAPAPVPPVKRELHHAGPKATPTPPTPPSQQVPTPPQQ